MTESAPRRSRPWWWWLPTVVLLGVLGVVGADRWSALPPDARLPSVAAIAAAAGCHLVANVLLAGGWRRQLVLLGRPVAWGPALAVWSTSQLSRFVLPGATFGARAVLARRLDVSAATGAATTVVELGLTLLAHPVVLLLALPWWADLPDGLQWIGVAAVLPVGLLVALVARPAAAVRLLATGLARLPVVGRRVPPVDELGTSTLTSTDAAGLVGFHLGNVALRHLAFVLLLSSTLDLDGAGVAAVVGASALGRFVGLVSVFAPAGLGPREGMTVLALVGVTGAGPAIVAVAVTRLVELVAEAALWGATRPHARRDAGAEPGATGSA